MIVDTFLITVLDIVKSILVAYKWIIIIYTLLSWIHIRNEITNMIERVSEPAIYFVKSKINTTFYQVDFAPIIVIIAIEFLDRFLITVLYNLVSTS